MTTHIPTSADQTWTLFIETLSDEFLANTGFGVYAHITFMDIGKAYRQYQQYQQQKSMRHFARNYVRSNFG
jgi:hypothetical protein